MYEPLESVPLPKRVRNTPLKRGWVMMDDPDTEFRFQHFWLALSEHPAARPILEQHGRRFVIHDDGKLDIAKATGASSHEDFGLALWHDSTIWALFDQYSLTIYEG